MQLFDLTQFSPLCHRDGQPGTLRHTAGGSDKSTLDPHQPPPSHRALGESFGQLRPRRSTAFDQKACRSGPSLKHPGTVMPLWSLLLHFIEVYSLCLLYEIGHMIKRHLKMCTSFFFEETGGSPSANVRSVRSSKSPGFCERNLDVSLRVWNPMLCHGRECSLQ